MTGHRATPKNPTQTWGTPVAPTTDQLRLTDWDEWDQVTFPMAYDEEPQRAVVKDPPQGLTALLLDMARAEAYELAALVAWMGEEPELRNLREPQTRGGV
jgi:hypothetical protein